MRLGAPRAALRPFASLGSASNETNVELVQQWRRHGFDAALLSPPDAAERLRCGDLALGRLDVLPTLDGVEPGLLELLLLERAGVRVLNPAAALLSAHDKLRTAQLLTRACLPHPWTMHLTPEANAPRLAAPVVLKRRFGSWGVDVFRCDTEQELTVVPGATHLFEEPGALEQVAELATRWFVRHL